MSIPLVIVTSSGVVTCIAWWDTCRVEEESVVLSCSRDDDADESDLVVAKLRSQAEASAFYRTLTHRVRVNASKFDAADWPGATRDHTFVGSAEDEG